QKNFSPPPVMMATRSSGSSRNLTNAWLMIRLVAASMALALGRSSTTSRMGPLRVMWRGPALTSRLLIGNGNALKAAHPRGKAWRPPWRRFMLRAAQKGGLPHDRLPTPHGPAPDDPARL